MTNATTPQPPARPHADAAAFEAAHATRDDPRVEDGGEYLYPDGASRGAGFGAYNEPPAHPTARAAAVARYWEARLTAEEEREKALTTAAPQLHPTNLQFFLPRLGLATEPNAKALCASFRDGGGASFSRYVARLVQEQKDRTAATRAKFEKALAALPGGTPDPNSLDQRRAAPVPAVRPATGPANR